MKQWNIFFLGTNFYIFFSHKRSRKIRCGALSSEISSWTVAGICSPFRFRKNNNWITLQLVVVGRANVSTQFHRLVCGTYCGISASCFTIQICHICIYCIRKMGSSSSGRLSHPAEAETWRWIFHCYQSELFHPAIALLVMMDKKRFPVNTRSDISLIAQHEIVQLLRQSPAGINCRFPVTLLVHQTITVLSPRIRLQTSALYSSTRNNNFRFLFWMRICPFLPCGR